MTKEEWAEVLGGLQEDDPGLCRATLEMTDEDWMSDWFREWVRKKLTRTFSRGFRPRPHKSYGYFWLADGSDEEDSRTPFCCPPSLVRKLENDPTYGQNYTIDYPTPAAAWLALLQALEDAR